MLEKRTGVLLALFMGVFLVNPPFAHADKSAPEDVAGIFCEAMQDEAEYDKYSYDAYKILVAGKDGWIFRSESDFRTDFTITEEALDRLEELNNSFTRRGTELVILMAPTRAMMHHENISEQDRKKYRIEDIDPVWESYWSAIDSIRGRGIHVVGVDRVEGGKNYFYKRDHHWSPEGAKISAQKVSAYIKRLPAYGDVSKVEYISRESGPYEFEGVSKKVFSELCGTVQPPEIITRYITERADTTNAPTDLFGKTVNPDIVLFGTSNSTMIPSFANFEGFLKEALSADVLNMSVSGGGLDTAMISYFNSPFFREKPAKIAIWEIPGNYNLSEQSNFFREAIPAVYGSCEDPVDFAENQPITDKTLVVLDGLRDKKIKGGNYYLNFVFDQPVTKSFTVDVRYDETRDRYKFYRSSRTPNDNQFFLELEDDKKETLDKVALYLPVTLLGQTVDTKLCKKSGGEGFLASMAGGKELNPAGRVKELLKKIKAAIKLDGEFR